MIHISISIVIKIEMEEGRRKEGSQSISTERTRAPSLAKRAASGRPTTSDLDDGSAKIPAVILKFGPGRRFTC